MINNHQVSIQDRTRKFAVRIVKAYSEIIKTKHFTKESQEFNYWCQVMIESEIVPSQKFEFLLQENQEISNILAASINSIKKKNF